MYPVFILLLAIFWPISGQVNDTPGGNFTIQFVEYPGRCPELPDSELTLQNRFYEGRWYFVQVGFSPSQARTLSCMTWDSFFDQQGILHNFLYGFESGQFVTGNTRLTPVKGRKGIYLIETGAPNNDQLIATLYYMDGDIFVFGEVTCRENGNHYRNTVIGVRDLRLLRSRSEQIDSLVSQMEREGGFESDKTRITHSRNCRYPPPRRNPYTSRSTGNGYGGGRRYGGYYN